MRKSVNLVSTLFLFLVKAHLYTLKNFDKDMEKKLKETYNMSERTLQNFSDSDFYDIKLDECRLTLEINELICQFIISSTSRNFKIFLDFDSKAQRAEKIPDALYFYGLKKLKQNNLAFEINYICEVKDNYSVYNKKHFVFPNKILSHVTNLLFNVTLIFRKFYTCLFSFSGISRRYSSGNYRFMIFDSDFKFENIVGLPSKKLEPQMEFSVRRDKAVTGTKLKLNGKLPKCQNINDYNSVLKEKIDLFSTLKKNYLIKAYWRFKSRVAENKNQKINTEVYYFQLEAFYSNCIQKLNKSTDLDFINLISKKVYSIEYKSHCEGSFDSTHYSREITIYLSWHYMRSYFRFYREENSTKYIFESSLFNHFELFEMIFDGYLNITDVKDKVKKNIIWKKGLIIDRYENICYEFLNELCCRIGM
ncbi:hypothetical protein CWI36_1868p0010 [Hamiltosporidium magnivora]|uniref:Uncharacterized protein n=1 Tax=Hamiltosporidium magnivora TaxID=148818 RepID=A0A4V2JUD0_9MICR|nr:hypothetical protein CWI36_1868p0010 [Hamiltosporidium magnivora]